MGDIEVRASIAPWLAVHNGREAVEFYRNALGAVEAYRLDGDDGEVIVAQLTVGDATFWVQDDPANTPDPPPCASVRMIVTVDDPDAGLDRAIAAGASLVAAVHEEHGWRTGRVTDPFGYDWEFSRPITE